MAEYGKMKNVELETLLKQRNLPRAGKKADMINRLLEADKKDASTTKASTATSTAAASPVAEEHNDAEPAMAATAVSSMPAAPDDEIDWGDDAAMAAGDPTAVDPTAGEASAVSETRPTQPTNAPNDESEAKSTAESAAAASLPPDTACSSVGGTATQPSATTSSFTCGLAPSSLESELVKRAARAKKFGLSTEIASSETAESEAKKLMDRAKKFGSSVANAPVGLDVALPDRQTRKRAREGGEEGKGPMRRIGEDDFRKSFARRGMRGRRGDGRKFGWMAESDVAKAEARKLRFAAAT